METVTIDATKKSPGRIASEAAKFLQGKQAADFRSHKIAPLRVVITNSDRMKFTGRKLKQKKYYRHTGTIGHLRTRTLERVFERDSREVVKRAVLGMLPKNRILKGRMKNLYVYREEQK